MTFTLYPAIDLKDGKCVRLYQGDMQKATVFSLEPAEQAARFEREGFEWLHIVDLNGAFAGRPVNEAAVKAILAQIKIPVQLGGGIRDMGSIDRWLKAGVSRVILGTVALRYPLLVKEACRLFPSRIAVGIDAKGGKVSVEGWAEVSDMKTVALAKKFEDSGVAAIIYTDISKDGAMQGPNFDETIALAQHVSIPIIASGGISSVEDIKRYKETEKIAGGVLGRALYEGRIKAVEALRLCSKPA